VPIRRFLCTGITGKTTTGDGYMFASVSRGVAQHVKTVANKNNTITTIPVRAKNL